jgi:DNA-binding transcriptional ArsR family regulator
MNTQAIITTEVATNSQTLNHTKAYFEKLRASADKASALMKVMANADRLMVLCQLSLGEKSVSELEDMLNIQQPTLSQQLTVLRNAALVSTRREGKNIIYAISSESAMAVMQVLHQEICQLLPE